LSFGVEYKKSESQEREVMSEKEKKGISPEIIAALIGVAGTIIAGIFFSGGGGSSTPPPSEPIVITATFMPTNTPMPTDTVAPGEPTSTPAPTDTPAPEPTDVPPVAIGQDWAQGCISSLWKPYSSNGPVEVIETDGCLSQPIFSFFVTGGKLSFIYEDRLSSAEVQGMFAPLPAEGTVSIYTSLKELRTSDIWVGIFAEPSIDSQGLLMTIPSGASNERPLVFWEMPGLEKITTTASISQGSGYGVKFEYSAGSVRAVALPNVFATNTYPVTSQQKWLFIGYQGKNGTNRIESSFFDLVIGN